MNSTVSSTPNRSIECQLGISQLLQKPSLPTYVEAVLVFTTTVHLATCSFTILLNALVIAAVKTKRRLKTKANTLLACLASTDLLVGLLVQPCYVAMEIMLMLPSSNTSTASFCALSDVLAWKFDILCTASLYHLVLISGERYVALKHAILYNRGITNARLVISSVTAWLIALAICLLVIHKQVESFAITLGNASRAMCIILIFSFCIIVYREVRRYKTQAILQQHSLEAKEKIVYEIKIVKNTVIISVIALICYVPTMVFFITSEPANGEALSPEKSCIILILATSLTILNSLFNPLIHTARSRRFRVAFIQLLTRRSFRQSERFEKQLFGTSNMQPRPLQKQANVNGAGNDNDKPNIADLQIELQERDR